MSIIPATGCCCEEPGLFDCPVRQLCVTPDSGDWWDYIRAEYITVGRPKGPTVFPGTYWAAWHNGMHPDSELELSMSIEVIKRTVVQEECGGTAPAVTVPTGNNCATVGFLTATTGVKQTAYTDNFTWEMTGTMRLNGVVPELEQEWAIGSDPYHLLYFPDIPDPSVPGAEFGRPYPAIPKGYFPCSIEDSCGDPCGDPHEAVDFGTDPLWWPGENRKLMPRFFSKGMTVTATAEPASTYSQTAACDAVQYVDRCETETDEYTSTVCLDFPMVVLPGHSGVRCDGGNTLPCEQVNKENGANQALWGFDLLEPELLARFEAMNLPDGWYVGAGDDVWMVKWTNPDTTITKIRFLFDVSRKILAAGDTLKFSTDVTLTEAGTITRAAALESWRIEIDFSFTPKNWCLNAPECGCIQSYSENAPSVLTYEVTVPFTDLCSGPARVSLSIPIGLEDVVNTTFWAGANSHGLCPCGTSCECEEGSPYTGPNAWCFQWDELPSGGGGEPGETEKYFRFLGDEPIERGHKFWRRYRNKYNHTATTADWYFNGFGSATSPSVYGQISIAGKIFVEATSLFGCCGGITSGAGIEADLSGGVGDPCGSTVPLYNPSCNGGEGGFECLPEGCYDIEPPDAATGVEFWIKLLTFCNPYHSCGYQLLELGGGITYTNCELAGTSHSVSPPEVVVVNWNPLESCFPYGEIPSIYTTSAATVCEGKSAWSASTITVEIS